MKDIEFQNLPANPITGEIVCTMSEVGRELSELKEFMGQMRAYELTLRAAVNSVCLRDESSLTSYIHCEKGRVKVTHSAPAWDNIQLKKLWDIEDAKKYLRIERIAPNLREIKKLEKETGGDEFLKLKSDILGCKRESTSLPTVIFERES